MSAFARIALIHITGITLLVACTAVLNILAWSTTPDPFHDTLGTLLSCEGFSF